jgi:hypothetical protein
MKPWSMLLERYFWLFILSLPFLAVVGCYVWFICTSRGR